MENPYSWERIKRLYRPHMFILYGFVIGLFLKGWVSQSFLWKFAFLEFVIKPITSPALWWLRYRVFDLQAWGEMYLYNYYFVGGPNPGRPDYCPSKEVCERNGLDYTKLAHLKGMERI